MLERRPIQNGETMFLTTVTKNRQEYFSNPAAARIAVETLYTIQDFYPFFLHAFVIMPDHCHFLLRIPEGGSISKTMGVYKRAVAFNVGRGPLWQSRFDCRMPDNIYGTIDYIHNNPVVAGLCEIPEEYPWSSASGKWDIHPYEM
jgi:putative transposase